MTTTNQMLKKLNLINSYIKECIKHNNCPPTIREICNEFNIRSTSSAAYYLKKLEDMGEISLKPQFSRGISHLKQNNIDVENEFVELPLIGSIAAGAPIFAVEDYQDTYLLPKSLFNTKQSMFLLKVEGTSMIDIGINDSDIVVIKQQKHANNGDIVAALVNEDTATIKRFFKDEKNNVIRLHPENKNMLDIYPQTIEIIGIVTGLIRTNIK